MLIGQTESNSNDTLIKKEKLLNINKIRLGFDLLKPILSSSEGDNLNYEIVGDLQLTENIYLAGEYGLVDKVIEEMKMAQLEWVETALTKRSSILFKFKNLIESKNIAVYSPFCLPSPLPTPMYL